MGGGGGCSTVCTESMLKTNKHEGPRADTHKKTAWAHAQPGATPKRSAATVPVHLAELRLSPALNAGLVRDD
jgi:hypothetical protein